MNTASRIARSWIVPVAFGAACIGLAFWMGLLLGAQWGNTACFAAFDAILAEAEL